MRKLERGYVGENVSTFDEMHGNDKLSFAKDQLKIGFDYKGA